MTRRDRSPPNDLAEALAGELIGATVRIESHPGVAQLPLEGTIVDESLETFLVRLPGRPGSAGSRSPAPLARFSSRSGRYP